MQIDDLEEMNSKLNEMSWLEVAGIQQFVSALSQRDELVNFASNWLYIGRSRSAFERLFSYYPLYCEHKNTFSPFKSNNDV